MEHMKKQYSTKPLALMVLLVLWLVILPTEACPPDRSKCKNCISDQMKHGCPRCVPVLRCMAKCLWGGKSKTKCVKQCDCRGAKPSLTDCKKCMSRCRCSCSS